MAYMTGIATNQMKASGARAGTATPTGSGTSLNPNTPWAYNYVGNGKGSGGGPDPLHTGNTNTLGYYKNNGSTTDATMGTGAQGYGLYTLNSNASNNLAEQQNNATNYVNNMGSTEENMASNLRSSVGGQMSSNLDNSKSSDSSRGLLYGGIHAGNEGAIRAQASNEMAQGRSNINAGVAAAADQLTNSAIQSGVDIQEQTQTQNNAIYAQALQNMNANNSMFGAVGGAAGTIAGAYLGGTTGALAGNAAGRGLL